MRDAVGLAGSRFPGSGALPASIRYPVVLVALPLGSKASRPMVHLLGISFVLLLLAVADRLEEGRCC